MDTLNLNYHLKEMKEDNPSIINEKKLKGGE